VVEQCDAAAAEEGEEDGSTTGDGMVMMLCRLWTAAERVSSSLLPGMIHWLLEERRRWRSTIEISYSATGGAQRKREKRDYHVVR